MLGGADAKTHHVVAPLQGLEIGTHVDRFRPVVALDQQGGVGQELFDRLLHLLPALGRDRELVRHRANAGFALARGRATCT